MLASNDRNGDLVEIWLV